MFPIVALLLLAYAALYAFAAPLPVSALDLPVRNPLHLVELDVTSNESIAAAATILADQASGKLDCLVNNAGLPMMMPVLDSNIEAARTIFDVNLWGVLAMSQAFATMLIETKGILVNIGSIAGYMNSPFNGRTSEPT